MKKLIAVSTILLFSLTGLLALTFQELEQMMLSGNLDIMKARMAMESSLLDYSDAKAGYSPTVDLTVTGSYLFNPIEPITLQKDQVLSFLGLSDVGYGSAGEDYMTLYKGQERMMYQFQLQITQPLFTWGKIGKAVELYKAIYGARTLEMVQMEEQFSTELKTRLAALVYMEQMRQLAMQEKEMAGLLVSLAREAASSGVMLELDVREAEVQASQIDVMLVELEEQISAQLRQVATLCGLDALSLDEIDFVPNESLYRSFVYKDLNKLEKNAVSQSRTTFQLLGKLEVIAALANEIAQASVNWKPDIALVTTLGYSGSRFPLIETDWYRQDKSSSTLTVALKANVWDGGKALRNIARTQSQTSSVRIDVKAGQQEVLSRLRGSYSKIKLAVAQISYYDSRLGASEEKVARQQELLDVGAASEADLLKARMEVVRIRIERLQQLIELSSAYYIAAYLGS
ncbi:MAG: TolC family protein [Sphaerochaetaceae bacterium]